MAGRPNIYIDREESFDVYIDNRIYPIIMRVECGRIVKHEFQSPKMGLLLRNRSEILVTITALYLELAEKPRSSRKVPNSTIAKFCYSAIAEFITNRAYC